MKAFTNILVTGASGTVGKEVLKLLSNHLDKYRVTVFDKKTVHSERILAPYKKTMAIVYGDIAKIEHTEAVCPHQDVVIHLAGIIPPLADKFPQLAHRINVGGTRNIVNALEKYAPNASLLFSSSISVYGDKTNTPEITIQSQLNPSLGDEYAKTKIESENVIRGSKLNWSIFRLTAVMGYGNHKISELMFHMPLKTSIEIITPEDTARAFFNATQVTNELNHKIYNLGGGVNCRITYYNFLTRAFQVLGLGKVNFPENTFATTNFHCGFYMDGNELEKLLKFRSDTIDSYFKKLQQHTPNIQYWLSKIFRRAIKYRLLKKSSPYKAMKTNDKELIHRFFGHS